jgi:hypothetical protein
MRIMDTSYLRAIGLTDLRRLAKESPLFVPPYVVWELLDHLKENWGETQGQLAKLRFVRILDNPMAQLEQFKGLDATKNEWPNEEVALRPILGLILRSANHDDFDRNVVYSNGSQVLGTASSVFEKASDQLKTLEKEHVAQVNKMRSNLIKKNATSMQELSDEFLLAEVKSFCDSLACGYRRTGSEAGCLESKLLSLFYYYIGYLCLSEHRALLETRPATGQDYEDNFAFLHIPLDKKVHLFTCDKRQAAIAIQLARHINRVKPMGSCSKLWVTSIKMERKA